MGTRLRNEAQVRRFLLGQPQLVFALDYVLGKIYEKNADVIERIIYRAYSPQTYERTHEFKDAWGNDKPKVTGNHIRGKFEYEPDNMEANPPTNDMPMGQHYGVGSWGDSREYLAEIIYEGLAGPAFGDGSWRKKRDAWDLLCKEVDGDVIAKWFAEGCTKAGLNVKFIGSRGMDLK